MKTVNSKGDIIYYLNKPIKYKNEKHCVEYLLDLNNNDYFISYGYLMYKNIIYSISKEHKANNCRKITKIINKNKITIYENKF